ncbi:30S ribosomal protein S17 [Calditrichota bacterium]
MNERGSKRVQQGVVVSAKPDKSIVITVSRRLPHERYMKYFNRSKKFMAHDEENTCNEGDTVKIIECRPISKRKTWRLLEVVERKA